jgi:hypothetical protein
VCVVLYFSSSFPNLVVLGLVIADDDLAYFTFLFSVVFIHTVRHFPSFSHWLLSRFFAFLKNLIVRDFLFAILVPREEDEEERRISHYKSQLNDLRV